MHFYNSIYFSKGLQIYDAREPRSKNSVRFRGQVLSPVYKLKSGKHRWSSGNSPVLQVWIMVEQRQDPWWAHSCFLFLSLTGRKLRNLQPRHRGFNFGGGPTMEIPRKMIWWMQMYVDDPHNANKYVIA